MTNCNIMIPTYNRPAYLRRILNYYDSFSEGFRIIVADSSSDENKELNTRAVSSFSNIKISYINKYPLEIDPASKFADALNYVDTKYCVFCAEDNFITPNGITQSADFLEKNPDFAIAHGRYISFYLKDDKRGKRQFCWSPTYSHESITFPDPKIRLSQHLSSYSPTFYAVHRTDLLQMIWAENVRFMSAPRFSELLTSMLTLIYGKLKCLDVLYAAREAIPNSTSKTSKTFTDFMRDGTYNERYAKFRECLSTHLSKQAALDTKEAGDIVDEAMSAYIKKCYYPSNSKIGYISTRMGRILDYLNLPDWLDRGIRRSYTRLAESRYTRKASIDMSISSKYYDDFNKIRHHILASSGIIAE